MILTELLPDLLDDGRSIIPPDEICTESRGTEMMQLGDLSAERERFRVDDDRLAVVVDCQQVVVVVCIQFEILEIANAFARAEAFDGGVDADVRNGELRVLEDDDIRHGTERLEEVGPVLPCVRWRESDPLATLREDGFRGSAVGDIELPVRRQIDVAEARSRVAKYLE